jgi:hypothetical protein
MATAIVGGQPSPDGDRDAVPVGGKFPAHLDRPFRRGGGWLLVTVDCYQHGDPDEQVTCPFDDVEMATRDGSKLPG